MLAGQAVIINLGLTVIVIMYGSLGQDPVVDVAITIYCTVPSVVPRFINCWIIVGPLPVLAPVIFPDIDPIVQEKVLGTVASKVIFVDCLEQIVAVAVVMIAGLGLTVIVPVAFTVPQPPVRGIE